MPRFLPSLQPIHSFQRRDTPGLPLELALAGGLRSAPPSLLSLLCRECIAWREGKIKRGARRKRRNNINVNINVNISVNINIDIRPAGRLVDHADGRRPA